MSKTLSKSVKLYPDLLRDIKTRIRHAQNRAMQAVNTELLRLQNAYIFDFLTLREPFLESELEKGLRQFRLRLGSRDYTIDLPFYQLRLRCFVAIEQIEAELASFPAAADPSKKPRAQKRSKQASPGKRSRR